MLYCIACADSAVSFSVRSPSVKWCRTLRSYKFYHANDCHVIDKGTNKRMWNCSKKTLFFILLVISAVSLYVLQYHRSNPITDTDAEEYARRFVLRKLKPITEQKVLGSSTIIVVAKEPNRTMETKQVRILLWKNVFHCKKPSEFCPHLDGKCEFTADRSKYNTSDAVFVHIQGVKLADLPEIRYRPSGQKWIFGSRESPYQTRSSLRRFAGLFNVTMTYVSTSDIVWSYGMYVKNSGDNRSLHHRHRNYANGKKKMAVWFVSNCDTQSKREVYTALLQNYTQVHIYGRCGPRECPRSDDGRCHNDKTIVTKDYKFYLAFENSLCTDYITEKLWNALRTYVVPIVLGGANYSAFLPPHSYIDVKDFKSPKALAKYLDKLDRDDELYNEYFQWKATYTARPLRRGGCVQMCNMCREVYDKQHVEQTVDDLAEYWSETGQCVPTNVYYKDTTLRDVT